MALLGEHIGTGGGGGTSFGSLQAQPIFYGGTVALNESVDMQSVHNVAPFGLMYGDDFIVKSYGVITAERTTDSLVASGLKCVCLCVDEANLPFVIDENTKAYDVTISQQGKFASVTETDVSVSTVVAAWIDENAQGVAVEIPELSAGHFLFIYAAPQ